MDRYTKIVLTVVALCLVWICARDMVLRPRLPKPALRAHDKGKQTLRVHDQDVEPSHANVCLLLSTREELIMDFGLTAPSTSPGSSISIRIERYLPRIPWYSSGDS